jgi:hypothetical protein
LTRPSADAARHSVPGAARRGTGPLGTGPLGTGLLGTGLLGTAALLAACGTATQGTGATSASASPSSAHSARTATASPAPAASAGVTSCTTSALKAELDTAKSSGAAGSIYYPLDLTNISGSTCTLLGYPGVSFVTGPSGTLLGRTATRNPVAPAATITLAPGQVAHATLQVAEAGNYNQAQCSPVTAHWLRVFPPDQTAALYLHFTTQACSARLPHGVGSQLSVSVVRPGAS